MQIEILGKYGLFSLANHNLFPVIKKNENVLVFIHYYSFRKTFILIIIVLFNV